MNAILECFKPTSAVNIFVIKKKKNRNVDQNLLNIASLINKN